MSCDLAKRNNPRVEVIPSGSIRAEGIYTLTLHAPLLHTSVSVGADWVRFREPADGGA